MYSENGSITINGTEINVNGAAYAPNGSVIFNAYDTTITGFVCADTIIFNGSIFNVSAANFDMVAPQTKSLIKTYTVDEDFNEGSFNGLDLSIRDQLTLSEGENKTESAEKVYYDSDAGKGVKITYSSDKSVASGNETVTLKYDLCCFGEADINDNSVDLILVMDKPEKFFSLDEKKRVAFVDVVVRNVSVDMFKKSIRESFIDDVFPEEEPASNINVEREVVGKCSEADLKEFIKTLSDYQKEALMLKMTHGFSYSEIAESLNITEATARKRVSLAYAKIREFLEK